MERSWLVRLWMVVGRREKEQSGQRSMWEKIAKPSRAFGGICGQDVARYRGSRQRPGACVAVKQKELLAEEQVTGLIVQKRFRVMKE